MDSQTAEQHQHCSLQSAEIDKHSLQCSTTSLFNNINFYKYNSVKLISF